MLENDLVWLENIELKEFIKPGGYGKMVHISSQFFRFISIRLWR